MDLNAFPIIDHHAHPFLHKEGTHDADSYRSWFTESTSAIIHGQHVPNTIFYRTAIRWLAEVLECEPTETAVTEARAAYPEKEWAHRLFAEANIEVLLCDYGFGGIDAYNHEQMQQLVPCRVEPILRLETLAEELILSSDSFQDLTGRYVAAVESARSTGYVALKEHHRLSYRSRHRRRFACRCPSEFCRLGGRSSPPGQDTLGEQTSL